MNDGDETPLPPMCEDGTTWPHRRKPPCNRSATVYRDGKHLCAKHDPERMKRVLAAQKAATLDESATRAVLRSVPAEALWAELRRRGLN